MLEIKSLSAGYPGKPVLQNIHATIPEGKITAILGPNGCGKSTLLKTLCGILPAQRGQVLLHGEDLLALTPKMRAKKLSYLAQSRQIPDITVEKLVLHGRFPYLDYPRRYGKADYTCADAAMDAMGITELKDTLLQNLSGGQRQKAYLAMALAQDTPVILLDEPTTYLDIAHQLQLLQQARDLSRQGKTVVMVIHDLPHAFSWADKILLMEAGNLVSQGTPEEIFTSGMADRVFRVALRRTQTENGWRYYCEEK
jgi:iron complex transport system ATP-binding protein